ncbi:hypothetical protein KKB40_06370 [Patescibacteria group bacterium]|nr:hypothetical protein [Patescibacteria group bacterium]
MDCKFQRSKFIDCKFDGCTLSAVIPHRQQFCKRKFHQHRF